MELRCFGPDAAAKRSLAYSLNSPIQVVLVAEQDGVMVGSAIVWFSCWTARLYSISVDQEHRRRWIGMLLLKKVERLARARGCMFMRLEVRESNRAAIKFYARNKYAPVGRRPAYYSDGTDALRFEKEL